MLLGGDVVAQAQAGDTAISQAKVVYCGMKGLIEGNLGLVAGLIMAFLGVWGLINGGSLMTGIVFIVAGASLTAIPGMVESTLGGFGALIKEAGFTTKEQSISAFLCTSSDSPSPVQDYGNEKPLTSEQLDQRNRAANEQCTGGHLDCL